MNDLINQSPFSRSLFFLYANRPYTDEEYRKRILVNETSNIDISIQCSMYENTSIWIRKIRSYRPYILFPNEYNLFIFTFF